MIALCCNMPGSQVSKCHSRTKGCAGPRIGCQYTGGAIPGSIQTRYGCRIFARRTRGILIYGNSPLCADVTRINFHGVKRGGIDGRKTGIGLYIRVRIVTVIEKFTALEIEILTGLRVAG